MKKSLNFDLDTENLKKLYHKKSYTQAYDDIKRFLEENGFEHRQGSGYISKNNMTNIEVTDKIKQLSKHFDWFRYCCKILDYYNVEKEYDGLFVIKSIKNQTSSI